MEFSPNFRPSLNMYGLGCSKKSREDVFDGNFDSFKHLKYLRYLKKDLICLERRNKPLKNAQLKRLIVKNYDKMIDMIHNYS